MGYKFINVEMFKTPVIFISLPISSSYHNVCGAELPSSSVVAPAPAPATYKTSTKNSKKIKFNVKIISINMFKLFSIKRGNMFLFCFIGTDVKKLELFILNVRVGIKAGANS